MKAKDKLQLILKGVPLDEIQKLETQLMEEENNPDEGSGNPEEGSRTFVTKDELTATLEKLVEGIQASNIINDSAESSTASNIDKSVDVLLKNLTGESGESEESK